VTNSADRCKHLIAFFTKILTGRKSTRQEHCVSLEISLSVRVNIIQAMNGQGRFTAERVARTRPKTYRVIVRLLAHPDAKVEHIAQRHRVSTHTVRAIREREAVAIAERKKSLAAMLANVAELGAERMEETIGKASLRDAAIGTGVAIDKMLALAGQTPVGIQIANIQMPTPEQDEARRRAHHALDEITRLLHKPEPLTVKEELMIKTQLCVLSSGQDAAEGSQSREDAR
jgi:hypothetical protein